MSGEAEAKARATLPGRPAHVIYDVPSNVNGCFAGIFNGALPRGTVYPNGGLFIGKAECEWDWRETWGALRDLGLVEWHTEEVPNHPRVGGTSTHFHWSVTERGWQVREDDNAYFRELMDAMKADRKNT